MGATSGITLVFVMVMDKMEKKPQVLSKWGYLNYSGRQSMITYPRLKAKINSRLQS